MKLEKIIQAKKILIYGYGVEGKSSDIFLRKIFKSPLSRGLDEKIFIFDENIKKYSKKINFKDFDVIVVSAGISRRQKIPKELWERCTSNVEIFFENLSEEDRGKVIGISGSKGKSTTCQFLNEILKSSDLNSKIVGNFGVPFLDAVDFEEDFLVAELSSYQLEDLKVSPHLAIFTSFFSEHLEFHGSNENYLKAKKNLWKFQKRGDRLFTQEYLAPLVDENFSYKEAFRKNEQIVYSEILSENLFPKDSILRAEHFRGNLGMVWSLCEFLELDDLEKIWKNVAENFEIIPHRLEFFEEKNGIKFYDDAIAVNSEATIAAVRFFEKDLGSVIIGGQKDSGDGFDFFVEVLRQSCREVQIIILKSEVGDVFKVSFDAANPLNLLYKGDLNEELFFSKNLIEVETLDEAVNIAFEKTEKGKICLLSPAGKSYDKFKNFKEKGEKFKALVRGY